MKLFTAKNRKAVMLRAYEILKSFDFSISMKAAIHKAAKEVCAIIEVMTITSKKNKLPLKEQATKRQLSYLSDLLGDSLGFSPKWAAWFSKSEVSTAIQAAKDGKQVSINL